MRRVRGSMRRADKLSILHRKTRFAPFVAVRFSEIFPEARLIDRFLSDLPRRGLCFLLTPRRSDKKNGPTARVKPLGEGVPAGQVNRGTTSGRDAAMPRGTPLADSSNKCANPGRASSAIQSAAGRAANWPDWARVGSAPAGMRGELARAGARTRPGLGSPRGRSGRRAGLGWPSLSGRCGVPDATGAVHRAPLHHPATPTEVRHLYTPTTQLENTAPPRGCPSRGKRRSAGNPGQQGEGTRLDWG